MPTSRTSRLTIGMPVYNGADYLPDALDSILRQTFTDFELIISDNASTDETEAICRRYAAADDRIVYLRQEENVGAAGNFNLLVDAASAPYFRWACHDDILRPRCLQACIEILDTHPDVVLAYPDSTMIDGEGHTIPPGTHHIPDLHLMQETPHERFEKYMAGYIRGGMCNPLYGVMRTSMIADTARIDSYPASDLVLLGEIALRGRVFRIEEDLFLRRYHAKSSTRANESDAELIAWFDPEKDGTVVLTHWRHAYEYAAAIARSVPIVSGEWMRSYLVFLLTYIRIHRHRMKAELRKEAYRRFAVIRSTYSRRPALSSHPVPQGGTGKLAHEDRAVDAATEEEPFVSSQ